MPRKAKTLTLTVEERQQLETLVERGKPIIALCVRSAIS